MHEGDAPKSYLLLGVPGALAVQLSRPLGGDAPPIFRNRVTTCSINQFGVEAPAVTPTRLAPFRSSELISSSVSIKKLRGHCSWQTANSLMLFDECLPPIM